ncbi:MAG TPA: hypothetical protein VFA92_02355, partial [Candidatus Binatia bacterium]|nr:hypothetical protein [Candidatus Binatia bacterium]
NRVARELVPPPSHPPSQASAAAGGPAEPSRHPPPVVSGASGPEDLPELASQPPVAGGCTSILQAHMGRDDPATTTPEGVDERDPAELAQAAAAAEAQAEDRPEDQPAAAPSEQGQDLAPVPDTPSELVVASSPDPSRLRLLGLVLGLLTERTRQEQPPQLGTALARLGDGDQERARAQLSTLSLTLMGEDQLSDEGEQQLSEFLGEVLGGEMANGFGFSTMPEFQQALNAVTPELRHRLDTIVWSRNADAINILTAEDVEVLERVAVAMTAALILDTTYGGRPAQEDAEDGGDTENEAGTSTGADPQPE